jgi:hypothetical protein
MLIVNQNVVFVKYGSVKRKQIPINLVFFKNML